ncbi:BON domain-containing protein [Achromobacter sp. LC458]|uniref:BON domain-containing protein n=1 Tax=Achromobacter spanius TaxID=217203 RepID=A0A2S5GJW2_9BURK|nr:MULTISPECIES: BON domain-containing protein [Achromobacter]AYD64828.1 BON domain-containing protein [Achromobacter sp. B7]MDX3983652.1 BON domain-containing protein [Achromobacter sp.]PPA73248.1 BON domain-containing protein [Achromobacter spanius]QYJ24294.1 BON domain-containing protein [Achromobacter sp. ES-001]TRM53445.1 BON domain-containing protein [Achromobacter sp. LC458]
MNRDPRYTPRYDDDFERDPGADAGRGDPYRQAHQRGRSQGDPYRDPNRDPYRNPGSQGQGRGNRGAGDQEPWHDPAPSYGYQGDGNRPAPGARESRGGLRSRSADPGQSSYGGFRNEDPSYQREQVYGSRNPSYSGPTSYGDEEGGYYGDRPRWGDETGVSFETAERGGYNRGPTAWRDRGSFRTDPKGYTRSDERVRENVCEYLAHSGLDVSDVSVSVTDGRVTLEGTAPDRRTKHRIEDCTDACAGVQDVDNRIRIAGKGGAGESTATGDTAIGGGRE